MVASSIRTYKYRLFPTRRQAEALEQQLGEACRLYNAAIQERRDAWRMSRTRIDFYTQDKQLKEIRAADDDLNVKGLASSKLAKSVNDAGWSSFMFQLTSKAESAGRELVRVDPRGTSQTCLCGASVPKRLSDRERVCTACGLVADRDHVSAQVILQRARTEPSGANVAGRTACVA